MKLYWVGGPTFILELGAFRLLADPVFGQEIGAPGGAATRQAPLPSDDLGDIDYVVVSRNRADHVDAAAARYAAVEAIVPNHESSYAHQLGFTQQRALSWWDEVEADKNGESLRVTSLPTSYKDTQESHGFLFQHQAGDKSKNVYWTGDTLWFSGAREIQSKYDKLDLMVPVIGAVGGEDNLSTLSGKEAMQFVFMAQPKRIVPVGYNTFSHYTEGVDDLKARIDLTMYDKRLVILGEGETFERA